MQKTMNCPRCDGEGRIKGYNHVMSGICFKCGGSGQVAYRKPRKSRAVQTDHTAYAEEMGRKQDTAKELYKNDSRIRVATAHSYYFAHAMEFAKKDGIWETL